MLILRHEKEPAVKSSCAPLPLLSADVDVPEWSPADPAASEAARAPGTWLVFPRDDAVDAGMVDWSILLLGRVVKRVPLYRHLSTSSN